MITKLDQNEVFLTLVLFSDEYIFTFHGHFISQNRKIRVSRKPSLDLRVTYSHRERINDGASILGNQIIGPNVFEGNLTGHGLFSTDNNYSYTNKSMKSVTKNIPHAFFSTILNR